jgi:hypothetical protein
MGFNKMFYALGYVLVAAATGCLVVPVQDVGITSGVIFGVLMSGLVFLSARVDTAAHKRFGGNGTKRPFVVQLLAVMLFYVLVPAVVVGVLNLIVPSLVFFTAGWQMLVGLLWMPLFLASLLQFISKLP